MIHVKYKCILGSGSCEEYF